MSASILFVWQRGYQKRAAVTLEKLYSMHRLYWYAPLLFAPTDSDELETGGSISMHSPRKPATRSLCSSLQLGLMLFVAVVDCKWQTGTAMFHAYHQTAKSIDLRTKSKHTRQYSSFVTVHDNAQSKRLKASNHHWMIGMDMLMTMVMYDCGFYSSHFNAHKFVRTNDIINFPRVNSDCISARNTEQWSHLWPIGAKSREMHWFVSKYPTFTEVFCGSGTCCQG